MSEPKLHHYVPQFYLRRFADQSERLWIYDKEEDRSFPTDSNNIAAEKQFYRLPADMAADRDPLSIEKAHAELEAKASSILARLSAEITNASPNEKLTLGKTERVTLAEFLAAQHFRTLELRQLMLYLLKAGGIITDEMTADEKKAIQFTILAESGLIEEFAHSVYSAIWLFAKNGSAVPLITSDHPVCIKKRSHDMWIKSVDPLQDGSYMVFPMSPHIVLYCKEATYWKKLAKYDLSVSPITLDDEMVHHENCGQAFTASRFLISNTDDFEKVKDFIPSIGTDVHAQNINVEDALAVQRTAAFLEARKKNKKTL
jgi:hypothetical protein